MRKSQSRIEDMSPDGILEIAKTVNGMKITVQGSEWIWENSVEFCNNWTRSPKTLKALRKLFNTMNPEWENMKAYKDSTTDAILKIFLQEDGDCVIAIATKTNTIEINFEQISENTRNAREHVYNTIEEENNSDPLLD